MKKKMHGHSIGACLLSVVLMLCLAIHLGPMTVRAEGEDEEKQLEGITEIRINDLVYPIIGESIPYEFSIPEDAPYRKATDEYIEAIYDEEMWAGFKNSMVWGGVLEDDVEHDESFTCNPDDNPKFEEGKIYIFNIVLTAKEGYKFLGERPWEGVPDDITIILNDGALSTDEFYWRDNSDVWGADNVTFSFSSNVLVPKHAYKLATSVEGGNGSISESCEKVVEGTSKTVIFTPDKGYEIDWVKVNGEPVTVDSNELSVIMDKDKEVVVKYKAILYKIFYGDGSEYTKESGKTLVFKCNGPLDECIGIKIDNKQIESDNYTLVSGSTIITLSNAYLETLSTGSHTINAVYKNSQEPSAVFSVQVAPKPTPAPSKPASPAQPEEVVEAAPLTSPYTPRTGRPYTPNTGDPLGGHMIAFVVSLAGLVLVGKRLK